MTTRPARRSENRLARPTAPNERIHALDSLRGFALCGIIFVNIPQTMAMLPSSSVPTGVELFVLGRFYPIFVLLFGVGFGIFLRSTERRGDPARLLLARRFLFKVVFAYEHGVVRPASKRGRDAIVNPPGSDENRGRT